MTNLENQDIDDLDLDSLLYNSLLPLLSTDALRNANKTLKRQTRCIAKPIPEMMQQIEDIQFSCFTSQAAFENYSKFEVLNLSKQLLKRKLIDGEQSSTPNHSISRKDVARIQKGAKNPTRGRHQLESTPSSFRDQLAHSTNFFDDEALEQKMCENEQFIESSSEVIIAAIN